MTELLDYNPKYYYENGFYGRGKRNDVTWIVAKYLKENGYSISECKEEITTWIKTKCGGYHGSEHKAIKEAEKAVDKLFQM